MGTMPDERVGELRPVRDVSVATWIAPRLGPFGGWVGSIVPQGFEAYARILHPVPGPDQRRLTPTTWQAVCESTGRTPHALMQWHAIAGVVEVTRRRTTTRTMQWHGGEPEEGNLGAESLTALLRVLDRDSRGGQECFFALWEGYGWIKGSPSVGWLERSEPIRPFGPKPIPPAFDREVMAGPRLHHPGRDYLLFSGPLAASTTMGEPATPRWFIPQSPNLFWPADRSWCVASEIDLDSTLLGGSAGLVEAVLADPALEAWPVAPGDSLAHNSDTVNT